MSGSDRLALRSGSFEKCCTSRPSTVSRFFASPSFRSSLKSMPLSTPSSFELASSSALVASFNASPTFVATFWICGQRARSGT
jgi:hypothetical protein